MINVSIFIDFGFCNKEGGVDIILSFCWENHIRHKSFYQAEYYVLTQVWRGSLRFGFQNLYNSNRVQTVVNLQSEPNVVYGP